MMVRFTVACVLMLLIGVFKLSVISFQFVEDKDKQTAIAVKRHRGGAVSMSGEAFFRKA